MRRIALMVCVAVAVPMFAQERGRVYRPYAEWSTALPAFEKRMQALTAAIKRDAFIVSRVTLAMGDLADDFQKLSAIQKALDRIVEAQVKAGQDPPATEQTKLALSKMEDALKRGRDQGMMADTGDLRTVIMREAQSIQRELFRSVNEARGDRLNLVDLLNRVQTMNADLEGAMIEALGSTFDFMAAGGR